MMDSTRKNGWLKKKQTDIDVNHLITLFAKSRFITRMFILRLPHSARALSIIALLFMPLCVQAVNQKLDDELTQRCRHFRFY